MWHIANFASQESEMEAKAIVKWIMDRDGFEKMTLVDNDFYFHNDNDGDNPLDENELYQQFKLSPPKE